MSVLSCPVATTHPCMTLSGDLALLCRLTGIPALSFLSLN